MYQYASKDTANAEKSKTNTSSVNKSNVHIGIQMPVQTKSLFSPSFNAEKLKTNYTSRQSQLVPISYSPLQKQLMPKQESKEPQPIPMKLSEEQEQLAPDFTKPNNTGIPLQMKEKYENFSGFSFDDVKVHYHSGKPAQLQALAYTQGNQVYIAPGQEKHLGHELGHVVQQKLGWVLPTKRFNGMQFNDDSELERKADAAWSIVTAANNTSLSYGDIPLGNVVQRLVSNDLEPGTFAYIIRSTSKYLHRRKVSIITYLENNMYRVKVENIELTDDGSESQVDEEGARSTGQMIIARSDQLTEYCGENDLCKTPNEADLTELMGDGERDFVIKSYNDIKSLYPDVNFVVGGSFAIMLESFKQGKPARTPRDIDIFVSDKDYDRLRISGKLSAQKKLYGLPIEIHKQSEFKIIVTPEEETKKMLNKNRLLSLEVIKLIKDSQQFKVIICKSLTDGNFSPRLLLDDLRKNNEQLMSLKETDLAKERKKVWIKTLVDIDTLVNSGAELMRDLLEKYQ